MIRGIRNNKGEYDMAGFRDSVDTSDFIKATKKPKAWTIETGRTGTQGPINDWVGKVNGVDCAGNTWDPDDAKNQNDKGQLKRINNVFHEADGEWMVTIRYGTKILINGSAGGVTSIGDATSAATDVYNEIGNGDWDNDIRKAKKSMDEDRAKPKNK